MSETRQDRSSNVDLDAFLENTDEPQASEEAGGNVADKAVAATKDVSKGGAAVTAIGAFLGRKQIRRAALKQILKHKKIRKSAKKVVHVLISSDVVSKKDVRKLVGKKMAKKLAA